MTINCLTSPFSFFMAYFKTQQARVIEISRNTSNPGFTGKKHSDETRKKMSESTKGENHPMWGKTHSEETRNKISESTKGENNPRAKLNEKDVLQILFLRFYRKVQQKKIAKAFNVSPQTVSFICTRRKWIDQYDAFFEMEPYKHLKPQR